jgi:hypothetical protein
MDLKEFVSDSLTQIAEGVQLAQQRGTTSGVWINPAGSNITPRKENPIIRTVHGEGYLNDVHFDVAVTVSDEKKGNAGAGLKVFGVKLGAEGEASFQNAAVSRIQFSVQVVWPGQPQPELEKRFEEEKQARQQERERKRQLEDAEARNAEDWTGGRR